LFSTGFKKQSNWLSWQLSLTQGTTQTCSSHKPISTA
jgi:hypothetical protein